MLVQNSLHTDVVLNVDGKDRSVQTVQNAQTAKSLVHRVIKLPKVLEIIQNRLGSENFRAWIWGDESFAVASIEDDMMYGRILNLVYVKSEPGFRAKNVIGPVLNKWAKENNVKTMLTIVHEERAWTRTTGWKPWGLVLSKEVEND